MMSMRALFCIVNVTRLIYFNGTPAHDGRPSVCIPVEAFHGFVLRLVSSGRPAIRDFFL